MASVPNTRSAPSPTPAGKAPAALAGDPAGFAQQLAGIPEELLQAAAALPPGDGDGGDLPAPKGAEDGDGDATAATPSDPLSDAARLASLAPILQSLPAIVAAPIATSAPEPAAAGTAPAPAAAAQPKAVAAAAIASQPAPTATLPAPTTGQAPPAKPASATPGAQAEPETEGDAAGTDAGGRGKAPMLDKALKDAIAAAKRTIDAAARLGKPVAAAAAPRPQAPMARLAASVLGTVKEAAATAPAASISAPDAGSEASTAFAAQIAPAPAPTPSTAAAPRDAAAPAPDRTLDLAQDAAWLDRLARDIAQASGNEGAISFRLHPQTLGHLRVELSQGEHGTSIRLTADTEQARAILADAQPRLAAEARAQGVRIAETHVDLSGSDRQASGDPRRQDDPQRTPMIRTARGAAADADAPERPGRSRSDRYA